MCRNIKPLFNFDPPATDADVRNASVQFVRKLAGFTKPSQANEAAFERAVDEIAASARTLIDSLVTSAEPRQSGVGREDAGEIRAPLRRVIDVTLRSSQERNRRLRRLRRWLRLTLTSLS
jgi:hypothetical protein